MAEPVQKKRLTLNASINNLTVSILRHYSSMSREELQGVVDDVHTQYMAERKKWKDVIKLK